MPKTIGIIPARWGSTRFPGKPLHLIEDLHGALTRTSLQTLPLWMLGSDEVGGAGAPSLSKHSGDGLGGGRHGRRTMVSGCGGGAHPLAFDL